MFCSALLFRTQNSCLSLKTKHLQKTRSALFRRDYVLSGPPLLLLLFVGINSQSCQVSRAPSGPVY